MNVLKGLTRFEITSNLQCQKGARLNGVTWRDSVSKPNKKKIIVFVFWFLIELGMENERSQYPNHLFHEILLLRAPIHWASFKKTSQKPGNFNQYEKWMSWITEWKFWLFQLRNIKRCTANLAPFWHWLEYSPDRTLSVTINMEK